MYQVRANLKSGETIILFATEKVQRVRDFIKIYKESTNNVHGHGDGYQLEIWASTYPMKFEWDDVTSVYLKGN